MISENELNDNSSGRVKRLPLVGFFWDRRFLHYSWVSIAYSVLNIFLLWLFIDVFKIPTVVSSIIVIGGTFVLRYAAFRFLKIM